QINSRSGAMSTDQKVRKGEMEKWKGGSGTLLTITEREGNGRAGVHFATANGARDFSPRSGRLGVSPSAPRAVSLRWTPMQFSESINILNCLLFSGDPGGCPAHPAIDSIRMKAGLHGAEPRLLLRLLLALFVLSGPATLRGQFYYTTTSGGVVIKGYSGSGGD